MVKNLMLVVLAILLAGSLVENLRQHDECTAYKSRIEKRVMLEEQMRAEILVFQMTAVTACNAATRAYPGLARTCATIRNDAIPAVPPAEAE
jgi:hypothetical protein